MKSGCRLYAKMLEETREDRNKSSFDKDVHVNAYTFMLSCQRATAIIVYLVFTFPE